MRLLTVSVVGQQGLEKSIRGLGKALDTVKILDEGAAVIYNRLRSRFLIEQAPDGTKWPPSQAALRRARSGRGGGTLFDTGKLFRSIQLYAESQHTRAIGTNVTSPQGFPYAEKHQFGIGFPQRQFLGFAAEDMDLMAQVIIRRIAQGLQQGANQGSIGRASPTSGLL
jgi:phage virion morphogenesis protein